MHTIQRRVDVASAPQALYDVLLDLARAPEWNQSLRNVHHVHGLGVGATSEATYRMAGVDLDVHNTTLAAEWPSRIVVRATGAAWCEWAWRIEPTPIGARLTLHVAYEIPEAVRGQVGERLLFSRNVRDVEMQLEHVKDLVEREVHTFV